MGTTLIILAAFGIVLMILETFLPGMIAGILGALCTLSAVALVMTAEEFAAWPAWGRPIAAIGILAVTGLILLVWLRCFAVKIWHRTFTLQAAIPTVGPAADEPPVATEGVAITELRPLGRADFNGQRVEVRCEDGFAPAGSKIRITGREPGNLLVRLISASATASASL